MAEFVPTDPRGRKVLIVDDDEGILSLVELLVRTAGFQVATSMSGEDAIKKLADKPDVVILDLIMPGCGGLGVLQHLKTVEGPRPPVIIITAYANKDPAVAEAVKDPNVFQCQAKPLNHEMLLGAVHLCAKTQSLKGGQGRRPFGA
ncbi:MAG: response regulator [Elusimicrobia bacterium]|nr:response regulator [Elusimicrobiota bacterium]